MKKRYILILLLLLYMLIVCLAGGQWGDIFSHSLNFNSPDNMRKENTTLEKICDDFSTQITDINLLLNNKIVGVVYFGRDTCPFCQVYNGLLKKELEKNNELIIYKFDTDIWRNNENYQLVLSKYEITTVPSVIKINMDNTFEIFVADENMTDSEVEEAFHIFVTKKIEDELVHFKP